MKKCFLFLIFTLCLALLAGCIGTPVIYSECTCPTGGVQPPVSGGEGALKTGVAILASAADSKTGEAKYDVTVVAVLVDDNGVIQACAIDGVSTSVKFDEAGHITTDLSAAVATKNELGENYGMKKYGNAIAEWNEQAAAFARYVVGKTVAQVKGIAVDSGTKPTGTDLTASVTIKIGAFQTLVEKAAANAVHLGAQAGDVLKLAVTNGLSGTDATAEKAGNAQLETNAMALTLRGEVTSSCVIDSVQAKVGFDATGAITTDLAAAMPTKNELGENYGMKKYGNAIAEWNEQAAAFARYITGKTPAQVKGIAVNEDTKPTGADLTASVTISIGTFQALVEKAAR